MEKIHISILGGLALLIMIILIIPSVIVSPFVSKTNVFQVEDIVKNRKELKPSLNSFPTEASVEVAVYRTKSNLVEKVALEEYVAGVVASEMPVSFELEALKAQSLAARTFIVNRLLSDFSGGKKSHTDITDQSTFNQAYKNKEELKELWKDQYDVYMSKIEAAVFATRGFILTYDEEPIDPSFFSASNGYTENSEEIWSYPLPYLRSVESPWDKQSPHYHDQKVLELEQFEKKLGVKLDKNSVFAKVIAKTKGGRVKEIEISGQSFTGKEVRDLLDLKSTDFTLKKAGETVLIKTLGHGHGVGMSQYGANGMAKEGKTYKDIIHYYYKDIDISKVDPYIDTLVVKE
ncbi:stage II sporulation protein D [Bacillus weihaiensis]|uniref:stage II sporulation protein D n=1 Tax=Bacillus weihaiensis TaxID=1547283 RepID=UPI002356DC8C|nr:stage II sporulation protein D [Bacillus weihaiensis]